MSAFQRRFIAWQPVLTDHQAFTYQELSRQSGLPVIAHVSRMEDATRRAQGWADTQVTSIERRVVPNRGFLRYCLRQLLDHRDDVHLFGSAFAEPRMMLCLLMAAGLGVEFYLVSEPYSPVPFGYFSDRVRIVDRLKTRLRPLLYRCYVMALRRRLRGIFAISMLALTQYRQAGMPADRLFPFGYFIPGVSRAAEPAAADLSVSGNPLRIVFVGSLIPIKGLDVLIDAVHRVEALGIDIRLDVFGPGDPSAFGMDGDRICHRGRIPFGQAQQRMAAYDLLVLPSHYDGWGVVVNEALCAGVPVLCSDQVGAHVLIKTYGAGAVFARADVGALASLLAGVARDRSKLHAMRRACDDAAAAIQPSVAASYMLKVIRSPRRDQASIPSPWYRDPL